MSLPSGTRIGPYELLATLGAGGMGEVYRAKDSKLGREVAIKILPPAFADNAERLRRFEHEARILASLNHPNVVQVFEAGEHQGAPYLVMELLEGETLRERLHGKALPPKRSAELAREVAQGLAAAHEKGILHRDLKPENLFLTKDGRVKVLDFGLAKAQVASSGGRLETLGLTEALSEPGHVVGTTGYMSPEQVRGEAVDARSDLFSLGVVLWEMVTGARPFHRDSALETLHAVLKEELPELDPELKIPPALERILHSCLAKAPEGRFHSAHDLAFALENISEPSASGPAVRRVSARPKAWRAWGFGLAGAVLVLTWIGLSYSRRWFPFRPPTQPTFHRMTYRQGEILTARFLPGGQEVVVGASWGGEPVRVSRINLSNQEEKATDLEGFPLAVGVSGQWAIATRAFRVFAGAFSGTLAVGPIGDSTPREVLSEIPYADLSPNGTLAIVRTHGGRYSLECPPGTVLENEVRSLSHPRFSPDGSRLAFRRSAGGGKAHIAIRELRSGRTSRLTRDHSNLAGLAWNGEEVWFTAGERIPDEILAVARDGSERLVFRGSHSLELHDIGPGGRALVSESDQRLDVLAWNEGRPSPRVFERKDNFFLTDSSRDGRWLLGFHFDPGGRSHVVLFRSDGSPPVFLDEGGNCTLSPDGRWVVATVMARGPSFRLLPTGPGVSRSLTIIGLEEANLALFTADGEHLLVWGSETGRPWRMFRADLEGGNLAPLTPEGVAPSLDLPRLSPDGRRLVVERANTFVMANLEGPPSEPTFIQGLEPGEHVAGWTEDSRTLYVYRPGNPPLRIAKLDPSNGRRQSWKTFPCESRPGAYLDTVMVSPDGRNVAAQCYRDNGILYLLEGLK